MSNEKRIKVIFDTNIWINYLIGQQLQGMTELISNLRIEIILCEQLITEFKIVTSRKKFIRYFKPGKVDELLKLFEIIGIDVLVKDIPEICRDPKDDFLLRLIRESKADYLVTGDKDLLILKQFEGALILNPSEFENTVIEEM
jgi:uncharacterized protein